MSVCVGVVLLLDGCLADVADKQEEVREGGAPTGLTRSVEPPPREATPLPSCAGTCHSTHSAGSWAGGS